MAKKKRDPVSAYLAKIGRKGGQVKGPSKARDSEKMRAAAKKRWEKPPPSIDTPPPDNGGQS